MKNSITTLVAVAHAFLMALDDDRLEAYLAEWPPPDVTLRKVAPCSLPVLEFMEQAVKTAPETTKHLVNMLAAMADRLALGQTYSTEDFGAGFLERYGWSEFIGLRGPIPSERLACGVLMLGPEVEYPRHRHEAEEIYIPLTGKTRWLQGDLDWTVGDPGQPIYHAPWVPHAMNTGPSPLLALYLWRAGDLTQKSIVG